jgi:hypothetical protein
MTRKDWASRVLTLVLVWGLIGPAAAMPTQAAPELANGTISYIGDIGSNTVKDSGVTDVVITTTAAVASGDAIIVAYATDPSEDMDVTVSDSVGNQYQQAGMAVSMGDLRTYVFAAYNVAALPSGGTITVHQVVVYTSATPAARAAVASVFRGLAPVGALEQTCNGDGSGTSPSSGAATTVAANQLLIGAVGTDGPSGDTAGTWQNSFTALQRAGTTGGTADTNITVSMAYRIVTTAGSYTAAKTGITSSNWAAVISTFKSTDAGISYIGDVGSAQSKTSGTSLAVTTTAAVTAGDELMIAFAADSGGGTCTVTDSLPTSNTYNNVLEVTNSGNVRTIIFAAYNVTALPSGSTITINCATAVTARAAVVSAFRHLAHPGVVDQTHTGTGSSSSPSSGATSTTTQTYELLIGAVGMEGPRADNPGTWSNSFTDGLRLGTSYGSAGGDTDITVGLGWRIVGSTGAYTAAKGGLATSRDWAAAIVTFGVGYLRLLGDVNVDGLVNSTDALIILSADVGINTSQFCPMNCGDVNGDALVNSTDALIILSYDVGMTVSYPVGEPGCPSSITQPPGCSP